MQAPKKLNRIILLEGESTREVDLGLQSRKISKRNRCVL